MATGRIRTEDDGHVARVVIDNPARRNAVSHAMWGALGEALEALAARSDVRVVVLTGAGDGAFSAGNDISEFAEWRASPERRAAYDAASAGAVRALGAQPQPVIARIRGVCVGGGFELAQLCDIQVASDDARFGVTPAKLGIGYRLDDVQLLVDRIPARFVRELLFTGRIFDAADALRMGLVNRVVAAAEIDTVVDGYAVEIAANAPLSVSAAKLGIGEAVKPPPDRDRDRCQAAVDACNESEDAVEGRRAFAEKRRPIFRGR